jgi:Fur family ferric uptake transcriptional regulator
LVTGTGPITVNRSAAKCKLIAVVTCSDLLAAGLRKNLSMTASPNALPLRFDTIGEAIRALRESGLRLSTPRRLILEALFAADAPVSAAHLTRELHIDESSVYRNLETLEQHGVVRHVHLGHSPGLYGLVTAEPVEYLYCQQCTKVVAVAPDRLDEIRALVKTELGFDAQFTHFAIVGTCEDCATTQGKAASVNGETLHSHRDRIHAHPHNTPHQHSH